MGKKSFFTLLKEKLFFSRGIGAEKLPQEAEEEQDNPYLPWIRKIVEAVLQEKGISYRDFFPILIDGEDSEKTLFTAKELAPELNRMAIFTDNDAYFENFRDTIYEDEGLIIELFSGKRENFDALIGRAEGEIVILDFEKGQESISGRLFDNQLYIPVFKRKWERVGNIDIALPIGYNTMIVRGIGNLKKQPFLDKFERAFYDKE